MSDFIQTLVFAGAPIACAVLAYQTFALRQERKRLHRAVTYYEDTAEMHARYAASYNVAKKALQERESGYDMCGGCGLSLTPADIAKCPGETCPNFKKTIAPV